MSYFLILKNLVLYLDVALQVRFRPDKYLPLKDHPEVISWA